MAYIPKTKVNILDTPGYEFVIMSRNIPYVGPYIDLSYGKYYAGNSPLNATTELIKPDLGPNNFGSSKNTRIYHILNKNIYGSLKPKEEIPPSRPSPTEQDYKRGHYTRFFVKRVNQQMGFMEVDNHTYDSLVSQKDQYDYNLYQPGTIKWALKGNVVKTNSNILRRLEQKWPLITQFFSILDLWEEPLPSMMSLKETQGNQQESPTFLHEESPTFLHEKGGSLR
jgi:hypothetical protein